MSKTRMSPITDSLTIAERHELDVRTTVDRRRSISSRAWAGFSPRQRGATEASQNYQYTLFGGARGPGKSYWLRHEGVSTLVELAEQGIRQPIAGLFCEDYPSLTDRQISKIEVEFPPWLGQIRDSRSFGLAYHLYPSFGGGVLRLRNLDDPRKYQSSEFCWIGVDELTKNTLETFNILRGSLRWVGVPKPRFCGATNPGNLGHLWVRAFWIDSEFPPEMALIRGEFRFVRALPDDNPHLERSYWEMLESLPPDLSRAWRWGDWDVFEGQFFAELRRQTHGFGGDPPTGWTFRSIDYGESAPSAVYWWRVDQAGNLWAYRELYGAGMLYPELAERIREISVEADGKPEEIRYTVASPDIFMTSKGTGVVGSEMLMTHGVPVVRADNNRIEGWRHLKNYVHHNRIRVHTEHCRNWWRTVPAMIYDTHKPEDMDPDGEDHAAESTRYACMSRPRPMARVVEEIPLYSAARIHEVERPTGRRHRR